MNIYLAEDDPDDVYIFSVAADAVSPGTRIHVSRNGRELLNALQLLEGGRPHAIFLDLNMPTLNGFEMLDAITKAPSMANIPVIVHSTSNADADIQRSFDLGASHYIIKTPVFIRYKALLMKMFEIIRSGRITKERIDFVIAAE